MGLGDGCTALDHKLTAVLHQIKILVGGKEGAVKLFCLSVLSYLSDFGTEASIPSAAWPKFIIIHHRPSPFFLPPFFLQAVRNNVFGFEGLVFFFETRADSASLFLPLRMFQVGGIDFTKWSERAFKESNCMAGFLG